MSYPKFLYHPEKGAILLKSEKEEKELGSGYVDSPAKFDKKEEKKPAVVKKKKVSKKKKKVSKA